MVPEIQLMMRVERDAARQGNPVYDDRRGSAIDALIRTFGQAKRITHRVSRFAVGKQTFKQHEQGAPQCNCAC